MIVNEKIKQKDLKSVRVFHNSDYDGTVLISQGDNQIYLDPKLAQELADILSKVQPFKVMSDWERDHFRYNDDTNYKAEL